MGDRCLLPATWKRALSVLALAAPTAALLATQSVSRSCVPTNTHIHQVAFQSQTRSFRLIVDGGKGFHHDAIAL